VPGELAGSTPATLLLGEGTGWGHREQRDRHAKPECPAGIGSHRARRFLHDREVATLLVARSGVKTPSVLADQGATTREGGFTKTLFGDTNWFVPLPELPRAIQPAPVMSSMRTRRAFPVSATRMRPAESTKIPPS